MFTFSGDEPNGEPSTSRTDVHDETDFSMASLAKIEITQVCNLVNWCEYLIFLIVLVVVVWKNEMLIKLPVHSGWHS